jgi:hypothetical protein
MRYLETFSAYSLPKQTVHVATLVFHRVLQNIFITSRVRVLYPSR